MAGKMCIRDRDYHELSGRAKDMGSAAVLLAIIIALITWGTLLWSHYH